MHTYALTHYTYQSRTNLHKNHNNDFALGDFKMAARILLLAALVISITCSDIAFAFDPSPLQDFCVADLQKPVLVNGYACKDPKLVKAEDFYFSGLNREGNTSNPFGSIATRITVTQVPGFNTLGISIARADFAPGGVNPPHFHPRATEILTVLKGTLEAGFVTSNPENRLFTKVLRPGDLFVAPKGMIHFQKNIGRGKAVALASLGSQNPGVVTVPNTVFGSHPKISTDILAKAFQVDQFRIQQIQKNF